MVVPCGILYTFQMVQALSVWGEFVQIVLHTGIKMLKT